jgi:TRAP-type C4-dicarboxylate transport system permease small subunit
MKIITYAGPIGWCIVAIYYLVVLLCNNKAR